VVPTPPPPTSITLGLCDAPPSIRMQVPVRYADYNFLGIPPGQKLSCPAPSSGKHVVGVDFAKASVSKNLEALGTMTLYVDD
jgi:hypothetical protein